MKNKIVGEALYNIIRFAGVCALFCASVVAPIFLYQRNYDGATAWFVGGIFLFLILKDTDNEK